MSQTFLNPSNIQSLNKVKTELLLPWKKIGEKPCYTPIICQATLASSISCPSVVLIGDPSVGQVLTTCRNDTIANEMHVSSNKEVSSFTKFS